MQRPLGKRLAVTVMEKHQNKPHWQPTSQNLTNQALVRILLGYVLYIFGVGDFLFRLQNMRKIKSSPNGVSFERLS